MAYAPLGARGLTCEFGDKSTQCASAVASDPSICDVGSNAEICCLSCANAGSGTSSGTGSTVTINSTMEHSIETRVVVDRFAFARLDVEDDTGNSQDSKYVMDASKDHNATNNFRFSECSVVYFTEKLQALYE
nr:hypothetical protein BaRGS_012408 [Batillaria attramentaria]